MNNTRRNTEDAIKMRNSLNDYYSSLFANIFHNSIEVENLPSDLPKRYFIQQLYEHGGIAYDKKTELYLPYNLIGIDRYGLPTKCTLIQYVGGSFTRPINEVVILRANDKSTPIKMYVDVNVKKLVEIDIAIMQNIESTKTTTIVGVDGQQTLLSMTNIANSKRVGASVIYLDKSLANKVGETIKPIPIDAPYLVDKFLQDREKIMNETLTLLGVASTNTEKRERVQAIEVMSSQNFAIDCMNTLIDTFNYDAKFGGLDIRLKANTNLYELSEEQKEIDTKELNTNE